MTTAGNEPLSDTSTWNGTVITRVIKAWAAGYDMSIDKFADAVGINRRTLYRRMKSGRYDVADVRDFAAYMSKISGDHVTIADLYAGRVSVFRGPDSSAEGSDGDVVALRSFRPHLRLLRGYALGTRSHLADLKAAQ